LDHSANVRPAARRRSRARLTACLSLWAGVSLFIAGPAEGTVTVAKALTLPWYRPEPPVRVPESAPQKVPRSIVIDPGHGGVDGGTSGGGLLEKQIALDIALRLRDHLARLGFETPMTRVTDTDVSRLYPSGLASRHKRDLQNRLDLIRKTRSVGAISIHVNSSANPRDRGPLVFYAIQSEAGKALAAHVQAAVNSVSGSTQRPLPRKNLFIIRHSPCPAILVEVGFVTNADDAARLARPAYRQRMADAIAVAANRSLREAPIPPPYQKGSARVDWTLAP